MTKTILEKVMEEGPKPLDVRFTMDKAIIENCIRKFKFKVSEKLEKTFRFYRVTFYFNEAPYKDRVQANMHLISQTESDVTLFDNTPAGDLDKKKKIAKIQKENEEETKRMRMMAEKCPEHSFTGEAEKVEYNKDCLLLIIDKDTLSFLNNQAELLDAYRMKLLPIF